LWWAGGAVVVLFLALFLCTGSKPKVVAKKADTRVLSSKPAPEGKNPTPPIKHEKPVRPSAQHEKPSQPPKKSPDSSVKVVVQKTGGSSNPKTPETLKQARKASGVAEIKNLVCGLQRRYLYAEALQLLQNYQNSLSINQAQLQKEMEDAQKMLHFFEEIFFRFPIHAVKLSGNNGIPFEASKINCEGIFVKRANEPGPDVGYLKWEDIPVGLMLRCIEIIGLPKEYPLEAHQFALIHEQKEKAAEYLALVPRKVMEERERKEAEIAKVKEPKRLTQEQNDPKVKEPKRLTQEQEEEIFSLNSVTLVGFIHTYRYHKALQEFGKLAKELRSPDIQEKIATRVNEIKPLSELFDRLVNAINKKKLQDNRVDFENKVIGRLASADREKFQITLDKGILKEKWYTLPPKRLYEFFRKMDLKPEDSFVLGMFCLDNDLWDEANQSLIEFLKDRPGEKERVDICLAKKLRIPIPEGGFTPYQGTLVTKDERQRRLQGFVRYHGKWVTPEEKEKREAGYLLYQGKWVKPDEKQLLEEGYIEYQGKWYTPMALQDLRKQWEHAWTLETAHYNIRCNVSEEFLQELGKFMDAAYEHYVKFVGKTVGNRMTMYVFGNYEDYRAYCLKNGDAASLQANGFVSNKDKIAVLWLSSPQRVFGTALHEGFHMFEQHTYPDSRIPSWFAEARATQFEGYEWDGAKLEVHFIEPLRLHYLRAAFLEDELIPTAQLVLGDAGNWILQDMRKASIFYSECWGLYYFLSHTDAADYQMRFSSFVSVQDKKWQHFESVQNETHRCR
jgi:hypothetical protein